MRVTKIKFDGTSSGGRSPGDAQRADGMKYDDGRPSTPAKVLRADKSALHALRECRTRALEPGARTHHWRGSAGPKATDRLLAWPMKPFRTQGFAIRARAPGQL